MTTWLTSVAKSDVNDITSLSIYAQQVIGCPWPTKHDEMVTRKKVQELFDRDPRLNWWSMCNVVDWMRQQHRRPARLWMVPDSFREAWAAGALPELDARDECDDDLERMIDAALQIETDRYWRGRLIGSRGVAARRKTFESWLESSISV